MKIITNLIFLMLVFQTSQAQRFSQIRLKTGASLLFPSPGGRGYAYKGVNEALIATVVGGEFSCRFKNRKGAWYAGFIFQDSHINTSPNENNLVLSPAAASGFTGIFFGAPAKTVIYAGIEKFIKRDYTKPSKNYFSLTAGVGLAFTLNKFTDWEYTSAPETYDTRDGGIVRGYSSNVIKPSFPVAPSIYGGARYNITNKKGNEVFILELVYNHGLTSFYKQTVDYTLNDVPKRDVLKEKGLCAQLNLIVPLFGFPKIK